MSSKADRYTFHFKSEKRQMLKQGILQDVVASELVKKGDVLVSFADESNCEGNLILHDNCELSVNEKSILAKKAGYPYWHIDKNEDCVMAVEPLVNISSDKMIAEITLYPVIGEQKDMYKKLMGCLAETGVRFGIDEQAIKNAIAATEDGDGATLKCHAAVGQPVQHGEDAYARLKVEMGAIAGEMKKDGSLDYKERRMFVYVDEGQLIATVAPATSGSPGMDIHGEEIEPNQGRDIIIRVSEDAVYNEEKGEIYAGKAGVVSVVNNATFKVSSKQTISSDIDYSTGNIYAKNNVEITGGVKADFVVSVRGDIRIGQQVQSAVVNSHGNLVVGGGVLGEKTHLNIRGDIDLNFVENASVVAGGNIVLQKNAYYCRMEAGGAILGGGSSKIVGGRVICGDNLTIGDVGSISAEPAYIAVGTDVKRFQRHEQLQKTITELEEKLALLEQRLGVSDGKKPQKMIDLENSLTESRSQLRTLNLIKGSPEESLGKDEFSQCHAELVVSGTIVAGTIIRIGNELTTVEKNLEQQRFKIDTLFRAIVANPL